MILYHAIGGAHYQIKEVKCVDQKFNDSGDLMFKIENDDTWKYEYDYYNQAMFTSMQGAKDFLLEKLEARKEKAIKELKRVEQLKERINKY